MQVQLELFGQNQEQITKEADRYGRQIIFNNDELNVGQKVMHGFYEDMKVATVVKKNQKTVNLEFEDGSVEKCVGVSFLYWPTKEDIEED